MAQFTYRVRTAAQMEARLNQSSGNFISFIKSSYRPFQASANENCIRIMPPLGWDAPHWGMDIFVHYGIGPERGSVLCLDRGAPQIGMSGGECPICQELHMAIRDRDEELVKQLRPTKRVLIFLLNRKDEGQGVLIWAMPYTLDEKISKACRSREDGTWKMPDDPKSGYDIWLDRSGTGIQTRYDGIALATKPSAVKQQYTDFVIDNPLPECLHWRDYDEVKKLFEGGIGAADDDERPRHRSGGDYDRPSRPPRGGGSDRPSRPRDDDYPSDRPRRARDDDDDDRRYGSDPRYDDTINQNEPDPPWQGDPETEVDDPPPEPEAAPPRAEPPADEVTRPIRRPGAAAPRQGNGADHSPPPSSAGASRAEQLRAQFLSGGRK